MDNKKAKTLWSMVEDMVGTVEDIHSSVVCENDTKDTKESKDKGDIVISSTRAKQIIMCLENSLYDVEQVMDTDNPEQAKSILYDVGYELMYDLSQELGIDIESEYIDTNTFEPKSYKI